VSPKFAVLCAAIALAAQTPVQNGSISGTVTDSDSGTPLGTVTVSIVARAEGSNLSQITSRTDFQGHYKLPDVAPGEYVVTVKGEGTELARIAVSVAPGKDVPLSFAVDLPCQLTGRVVDEDKKPAYVDIVPVERYYQFGRVGFGQVGLTNSDENGNYKTQVKAGHTYYLLAKPVRRVVRNLPSSPDPDSRKPITSPTYYGDADLVEGAQAVTPHSGQTLEGIDIRLRRSKSFCAAGIMSWEGVPSLLPFEIDDASVHNGLTFGGSAFFVPSGGFTAADGSFRICDLHPGKYTLTVKSIVDGPFGATPIQIEDRDVTGLRVDAAPGVDLSGDVLWDGDPPAKAPQASLQILLLASNGLPRALTAKPEFPGRFKLSNVPASEYVVQVGGLPRGYYVKDITYGNLSVLHDLLRPGTAMAGGGLKVIIGQDGGTITAKVADKDATPLQAMVVWFLPAAALTPAQLEATLQVAGSDASGVCTSPVMPPGKYYVLTSNTRYDRSAAQIDRLWSARLRGTPVDLAPHATAQINLAPVRMF
jgi:Carboxypeptidase regulatory-like domain